MTATSQQSSRLLTWTPLLSLMHNVAFFIVMTNNAMYAKHYGIPDTTLGFSGTFYGILQMIGAPFFSTIVEKYGLKRSAQSVHMTTAVMHGIWYLLPNTFGLFASNLFGLLIHGPVTFQTIISFATAPGSDERTKYFGKLGLTFGVSFMLAPAVNVIASKVSLDPGANILAAIGISVIGAILSEVVLNDLDAMEASEAAKESEKSKEAKPQDWSKLTGILKRPNVLSAFLQRGFPILAIHASFFANQLYMIEKFDISPGLNSFNQAFLGIVLMLSHAFVGTIRHYFGEKLIPTVHKAIIVAGLFYLYFEYLFFFYIILILILVAMPILMNEIDGILTSAVEKRDEAYLLGVSNSSLSFLRAVAPTLGSFLLVNFGIQSIGVFIIACGGLALIIETLTPISTPTVKEE